MQREQRGHEPTFTPPKCVVTHNVSANASRLIPPWAGRGWQWQQRQRSATCARARHGRRRRYPLLQPPRCRRRDNGYRRRAATNARGGRGDHDDGDSDSGSDSGSTAGWRQRRRPRRRSAAPPVPAAARLRPQSSRRGRSVGRLPLSRKGRRLGAAGGTRQQPRPRPSTPPLATGAALHSGRRASAGVYRHAAAPPGRLAAAAVALLPRRPRGSRSRRDTGARGWGGGARGAGGRGKGMGC